MSDAPRVTLVRQQAWVYEHPRRDQRPIGSLRFGDAVRLRGAAAVAGKGCPAGFFAIEPRGYVCADDGVSADPADRRVAAQGVLQASPRLPLGYALSDGAPMYRRVPSPAEWGAVEGSLGPAGHSPELPYGHRGHERLAERRAPAVSGGRPWFLAGQGSLRRAEETELLRKFIPAGSALSFRRVFRAEGRDWLLSSDGTIVPVDRVRVYRRSSFVGVSLGSAARLPIAWFRHGAAPKFRLADGEFEEGGGRFAQRAFVELLPKPPAGPAGFTATQETWPDGGRVWVRTSDATVVDRLDKFWWQAGQEDRSLIVSISRGTLVAYEGHRPVYATLVSPGAGGAPRPGVDPVQTSSTPLGVFRVTYKTLLRTMSPEVGEPQKFWLADVPYTQFFQRPFALHAAYWHEDFGLPMSAGCINLSPADAAWLFAWTRPELPREWSGVTGQARAQRGSFVVVTR